MSPDQIRAEIFNWFLETYQEVAFSFRMNVFGFDDGQDKDYGKNQRKRYTKGIFALHAKQELRRRITNVFQYDTNGQYNALKNSLNKLAEKLVNVYIKFITETTDSDIFDMFIALANQSNQQHFVVGGITPILKLLEKYHEQAFYFTTQRMLGEAQNDKIAYLWKQLSDGVNAQKTIVEKFALINIKKHFFLTLFTLFVFTAVKPSLSNQTNGEIDSALLMRRTFNILILAGMFVAIKHFLHERMVSPAISAEMLSECHDNLAQAIDRHFTRNADKFVPKKVETQRDRDYQGETYSRPTHEKQSNVKQISHSEEDDISSDDQTSYEENEASNENNETPGQPKTFAELAEKTFDDLYQAELKKQQDQPKKLRSNTKVRGPTPNPYGQSSFPERNPYLKQKDKSKDVSKETRGKPAPEGIKDLDEKQVTTLKSEATVYQQLTQRGNTHSSWLIPLSLSPPTWIDSKAIPHALVKGRQAGDEKRAQVFSNVAQRGKLLPVNSQGAQGIKNYGSDRDPLILFDAEDNAHLYRYELVTLGRYADERVFCRQLKLANGNQVLIPDLFKASHKDGFPGIVEPYQGYQAYQQDYLAAQVDKAPVSVPAPTPR